AVPGALYLGLSPIGDKEHLRKSLHRTSRRRKVTRKYQLGVHYSNHAGDKKKLLPRQDGPRHFCGDSRAVATSDPFHSRHPELFCFANLAILFLTCLASSDAGHATTYALLRHETLFHPLPLASATLRPTQA